MSANIETETLLQKWRKAVLQGDTLKDRLAILRQLADVAGLHNEWESDVFEHERMRLANIELEIKRKTQLTRTELLAFDEELGECRNHHVLIKSLRNELSKFLEGHELDDQGIQLEGFRERLKLRPMAFEDSKAHYEKIIEEMRQRRWTLPSARSVFREAERMLADLIANEKSKRLDEEQNRITAMRAEVDSFNGPDRERFYRNILESLKCKWKRENIEAAKALHDDVSRKLKAFLLDEEEVRIESIRSEMTAYSQPDKIDYLRNLVRVIKQTEWKDQNAAGTLYKDVVNLLDTETELSKQRQAKASIARILLADESSTKDFEEIDQICQSIDRIYGKAWLENNQWTSSDWITAKEKDALRRTLLWYDKEAQKRRLQRNTRRYCHLTGLGLLSALGSGLMLAGVSFGPGIFLFPLLAGLPVVVTVLIQDVKTYVWAIIPALYMLIGASRFEMTFPVSLLVAGITVLGGIGLCHYCTEEYIKKL